MSFRKLNNLYIFLNRGYDDYYLTDGVKGDLFGPRYDEYFKKIETGIEDEISDSPNYIRQKSRSNNDDEQNYHYKNQNSYEKSFDDVTFDDLRPDSFDDNHPDTLGT